MFIVFRETEKVADTKMIIDSEKQEVAAGTNKKNTAEVAEEEEPEKEVCKIACVSWFVIIRYVDVILFYRESLLELFFMSTLQEIALEEYEKVREEKRKALVALKSKERKVELNKDLTKMQLLSSKQSEKKYMLKLISGSTTRD